MALIITPVFGSTLMKIQDGKLIREDEKGKMVRVLVIAVFMILSAVLTHILQILWMRNLMGISAIITLSTYFLLRPGSILFQIKLLPALEKVYDKFIQFALKGISPLLIFIGVIILLMSSINLIQNNAPKVVFFPETDPLYINAFVDLPIGSDISSTNDLMLKLEEKVEKSIKPFTDAGIVEAVLSQIGENTADPMAPPEPGATPNKARITVAFVPSEKRKGLSTFDAMDSIRNALTGYAGVSIVVDRNAEGPPTGKPINLEIFGDDKSMKELSIVASDILKYLEKINVPGVEELNMNITANVQQDIIEIDRESARRYGLSTLDVSKALNTALYGREVSKFKVRDEEYPIILRFNDEYRNDNEALMNQMVTFRNMDAGGRIVQIPVSSVARKKPSSTYSAVKRKNEKRTITIYSNILEGYNANEIVNELKEAMEAYADEYLTEDYSYLFSGEQEEMAENSAFLANAMLVAVFAIFLILVSQFNSFVSPFIIVLTILFSTIGVLLGYWNSGMDLVIVMTGIGIISLAGIVVNNAIVLIDYINFLQQRMKLKLNKEFLSDEEIKSTIIKGGETRLRPVLLTAITTVLGLIPLANGFNFDFGSFITELDPHLFIGGDNAALWGAMSWTIIYGLMFATFLTLIVVPVMYWLFYKLTKFIRKIFGYAV